jgi:HPt (histidine-containing phosphotransfer) domain-containing protein
MSGWTVRFAALTTFLVVLVISSAWEMHSLRHDGESRLQQDAASLAKRAGLHLAGATWHMDAPAARNFIFVEMEDLRLTAMLIHDREGLLAGMRRNGLWEPVPWDDLTPENSVEAAVPIMMEDVPVGSVIIYLSRRALEEELSAKARRELARVSALAVIPCTALALLLWQFATHRTTQDMDARLACSMPPQSHPPAETRNSDRDKRQAADQALPLHLPPDWDRAEVRHVYLEECRAFIRTQRNSASLLCQLTAREDWGELRATAHALREAALVLNARPLAAAALAVQEAALSNTASAARHVEECIPALTQALTALEQLVSE